MRKTSIITIGMSILGGIVLGSFAPTIEAASLENSQASVNILGGDLSMTEVDDINFDDIEIDGKDHINDGNDISIKFSDYRGSAAEGFELKVKSDKSFANKGLLLELSPKSINNEQAIIASRFELTDEFHQVAVGEKEVISGEATDYDMAVGTHLFADKTTKAGTYQTVLTWDLSATPNE
ncbi:conserved exported hypothetical protein [Carnobacterium maltaromaticum]|uniref:hypothetical protein n=1 Tax=Carnobacterium maltaromaticum TaxID=2751 RepID=UPI00191B9E9D|nr:hypothetical protein [Carnobacterium maltaromaticum]CAD5896748.1 conserved exported hypothetical protein [Carnobacterium maltaromaticum]